MSDLISRSELLKRLEEWNTSDKTDKALYNFALNRIIEQPTAYDIDKVVEELEEKARTVNVIGYGTIYEAINKDVAIEIVRQGGVETETETIRDKAVKWNNNSSKRVPYEFIDYVEGKREICVSDNVCEWKVKSNYYVTECSHDTDVMYGLKQDFKFCPYCGKKIKVVE